jgi:pimeloyl-ACP methyl ester carboxylesterase
VDLTDSQLEHLYGRIACPTLLVYGRDSWATSPAEDGRLEHFGNARVVMIEDAGHWPHHDQADVFIAAVAEFLAG